MIAGCSMSPEQEKDCLIGIGIGAVVGGGIGAIGAATSRHGSCKAYSIGTSQLRALVKWRVVRSRTYNRLLSSPDCNGSRIAQARANSARPRQPITPS